MDLFNGFDVFGFTKRQYQGQDMLSMVYRHEYSAILNNKYEIEKKVFAEPEHEFNMHEFNMVDNGTRLLQMVVKTKNTSKKLSKEVGYNGKCMIPVASGCCSGHELTTYTRPSAILRV